MIVNIQLDTDLIKNCISRNILTVELNSVYGVYFVNKELLGNPAAWTIDEDNEGQVVIYTGKING